HHRRPRARTRTDHAADRPRSAGRSECGGARAPADLGERSQRTGAPRGRGAAAGGRRRPAPPPHQALRTRRFSGSGRGNDRGMSLVHRVLPPDPIATLDEYVTARGGRGLEAARAMSQEEIVAVVDASGLRGRGGGGFPTGRKSRTVIENGSESQRPTVVVNGAEGEPGTFKDRTILRLDPYRVLEGALIAALAVGADEVVVALKRTFTREVKRVRAAIAELDAAGWTEGIKVSVFEGPSEYLYGEETALLEVLDGRLPFPRIAPPYRRGIDEVVQTPADLGTQS